MIAVDAALVARARAGDQAAFADLVARHGGPAWRIASALAPSPAVAEHAAARAFTTALRQLDAGTVSTSTAFRVLVTRAAIDEVSHAAPDDATVAAAANPLIAAYRTLPLRWRAVLWLTIVEGGSTAQVGALLAQPTDAVGRLARRAQAGLRQRYLASGGNRGDRALQDQRGALRPLATTVPPSLGGAALNMWLAWRAGLDDDRRGLAGLAGFAAIGPWAERTVAGAVAAVITAGIAAAVALGGKDATTKSVTAAPAGSGELAAGAAGAGPADSGEDAVPSSPPPAGPNSRATASAPAAATIDSTVPVGLVGTDPIAYTPLAPAAPPPLPRADEPPATTVPDGVTVTADLPGTPVGVTVGPSPGVQIGTTTVGTPPPVTGTGVTVSAQVPGLPPIVVRVL